ncbi:MAG: PcfB family protein [Clostridia bacterium]|nr:PcfB family protein [Clostridia bacterium]
MNNGGDAAEQIVRMSLEGFEVAAKITGDGTKNLAVLLYSILKDEKKTKGKSRLTSMLRSGKELKVFTVKNEDLKKFQQEAKRYGVLYCVLRDKEDKSPGAVADVIARAEDAAKISRIVERFNLVSAVEKVSIVNTVKEDLENKNLDKSEISFEVSKKDEAYKLPRDIPLNSNQKEVQSQSNPLPAKIEKSPLSELSLEKHKTYAKGITGTEKNSVQEKLREIIQGRKEQGNEVSVKEEKAKDTMKKNIPQQTKHHQPLPKKKSNKKKER